MRQVIRFICDECNHEHPTPELAVRCEKCDRENKRIRKAAEDVEKKWNRKGHDVWHEQGGMKHALRVNPKKFGGHDYGDHGGTNDCAYQCGCWMGSCSSGGPVNPFGACPKNLQIPLLDEHC
jgi:hypothetical protein